MRHPVISAIYSVLLGSFLLTGCTTVTVSSANEELSFSGIMHKVNLPISQELVAVNSRGFGFFSNDQGLNVGWLSESRIYLPKIGGDCRVIVITNEPQEIWNMISLLKLNGASLSGICISKQGESK